MGGDKTMTARSLVFAGLLLAVEAFAQPSNVLDSSPEFYKSLSLDQLMDLKVTSVSRQAEPYSTAPASLQVITGDEIRHFGATSFPEALRLADNLDIAQRSSASWAISARGFNASVGNKLLVLMDGRTLYTPLLSGVIWNVQDYLMQDIDRIEVVSGPGGTLWGANAVNGVINIVSKDARETQGLYVEAGGGNWLQDFTGIRYGGVLGTNVYYRVYGKYFDRGEEVFRDGTSAQDGWNRGQGGFRIDDDRSVRDKLTLQGDFYAGDTSVVPGGERTPRAVGTAGGGNLLGRWTHSLQEDSDLSLQLYYDRAHLGAPFQSAGAVPPGVFHNDIDTYDIDFQHRVPIGDRHRFIWGGEYRFMHFDSRDAPLVGFEPRVLDQNLFSAFVQDEIKLREDLFFTLGTKIEHNDYTGLEFDPSARLAWHATPSHMVWAAVSRAVRTPARYDRDLFEPAPGYGTFLGTSNSNFRSESVIAYELGYRGELAKRISGSVTLFYNQYDHLRTLGTTHGGLPLVFENNLRGYTYGLELSSDYQVTEGWRLHFGYDLLEEHLRVRPNAVDVFAGLNETADPKHQVFLRSTFDLPHSVEFSTALRLIDTIHNNRGAVAGTVPSYAELDARLAWRPITALELSIVGQNLLHQYHPES
ncbi:MAG: TonB-dependent receptor plug, partial [Verrucomicrobiales bacterium]|nr:TonB-dependent receptor plug [Verrucomicrobiales bacterium]